MGTIELNQKSLEQAKKSAFWNFEASKKEILATPFDSEKEEDVKRILKDYSSMLESWHPRISNYKASILSPQNAVALNYWKEAIKFLEDNFWALESAYEEYQTMMWIDSYFKSLDKDIDKAFDKYLEEYKILDESKKDPTELKNDFKIWLDKQIDENKMYKHMEDSQKAVIKTIDFDIVWLNWEITSSSIDDLEQELLVSNNISFSSEKLEKESKEIKYSEKKFLNKIFGLGNGPFSNKIDWNLSIATENYVVRGEEKKVLKEMRDIFEYFVDEEKPLSNVFEDLNKAQLVEDDWNEEYREKVMELNNLQEEIKKYSYVSRLWETLDDKSKSGELNSAKDNAWENLYKDLYIGNNEDLVSNKRKAVKTLFDGLEKNPSVRELKWYINSLDTDKFFAMFTYAGIDSIQKLEDGLKKNASKGVYETMTTYLDENFDDYSKPKAVKFAQFIIKSYLKKDRDTNLTDADKTLDKVISGYISGRNLVDIANAGKVMEKMEWDKDIEDILNLLGNKNFDNKLDFNDGDIKTGLQFKEIVLTEKRKLDISPEQAINRILSFSKTLFEKMGIVYSPYVEKINVLWNKASLDDVFNLFKQDPGLLSSISDVFTKTPVPVSYIMRYGESAFEKYNKDWNNKSLDKLGEDAEIKETIDKWFDSLYNKLLDEWLNDDSEIKEKLRLHYHGLMLDGSQWLKAGTSLSAFVKSKIGTLSATVWVVWSGEWAQVGVMLWWNNQIEINDTTSVYGGLNWWISWPVWMPIAAWNVGISKVLNKDMLDNILHASADKRLSLGWNVTILPVWSRGVSASYEKNKMAWIEKTAESISKKTVEITKDILTKLSATANGLEWLPEISIENIKNILEEKFPKEKNKSWELEQAATNIYRWLQYFGLDKTKSLDKDTITQISDMMWEFYATSWKNDSMSGLDRFHVSSAGVGIQFLAWFYPIPTVVVWLTKYRNKVWENTAYSKKRDEAMYREWRGLREYLNDDWKKDIDWYVLKINDTIDSKGAKYKIVRDEKIISIPMDITRNDCNVFISKDMKDYMKVENWKLIVPATSNLSFMKLTGWETIKHVLVIWAKNVEEDSMKIDINSKLDWNPNEFKPVLEKLPEIETRINTINLSLIDKDFEKEIENLKLFENISALQEAETITDRKTWEIYDNKYYYQMLSHLDSVWSNWEIGNLEIDSAVESLKNLDRMRGDKVLDSVIKYIDQNQTDRVKVTRVLNKLKQIFAWEPDKYPKMQLSEMFDQRMKDGKEAHLSLVWPNKDSKFPEFLNKKELFIDWNVKFSEKYVSRPDLLWFTAFYRKAAGKWRSFSMTSLWWVEVQPNTEKIIEDEEQKKESFCWFMDNFETQKYEQQMLRERIMKSMDSKLSFDADVLKDLLESSNQWKSIDIDWKNVKINFDVVFYLLGECANESLWLSINSIDIEQKEEPREPKILQNLYIWDSESTNEAIYKDKKDVSVGFTFAKEKKKEEPENGTDIVDDPEVPENETEVVDLPELNVENLTDVELNQITIDGTNYSLVNLGDWKVYVNVENKGLVQVYNNNWTPTLSTTVEIPVIRAEPVDLLPPIENLADNEINESWVKNNVVLNNLWSDIKINKNNKKNKK